MIGLIKADVSVPIRIINRSRVQTRSRLEFVNRYTLIRHELEFVIYKLVCASVDNVYKKTTQLVEGLRAVFLDKVTVAVTDECLKTTELFAELNPDSRKSVGLWIIV